VEDGGPTLAPPLLHLTTTFSGLAPVAPSLTAAPVKDVAFSFSPWSRAGRKKPCPYTSPESLYPYRVEDTQSRFTFLAPQHPQLSTGDFFECSFPPFLPLQGGCPDPGPGQAPLPKLPPIPPCPLDFTLIEFFQERPPVPYLWTEV